MEKTLQPKVSVIMPVYNAEKYLRESLDCLLNQSCPDFEVLCVDDGSTDESLTILHEYAARDPRFSIYTQSHMYAGAARNLGIQHARGKYLQFVDADDLFSTELIAAPFARCEQTQADICIYLQDTFEQNNGRRIPVNESCISDLYAQDIFSRSDDPRKIFFVTLSGPCNKIFRRQFILDHGIEFQNIRNSEDTAFVMSALALAKKVTTLPQTFYSYRQHEASLQHNTDKNPFCFYEALLELRKRLKAYGLYEELKDAFLNFCASDIIYMLSISTRPCIFEQIYTFIRQQGLRELELQNLPAQFFYARPDADTACRLDIIQNKSIFDYVGKYGPDFGIIQQRMTLPTLRRTLSYNLRRTLKNILRMLKLSN